MKIDKKVLIALICSGLAVGLIFVTNYDQSISCDKALELIKDGDVDEMTVLEGQHAALLTMKNSNRVINVEKLSVDNISPFIELSKLGKLKLECRTTCPAK